jgi:hypothetical protein
MIFRALYRGSLIYDAFKDGSTGKTLDEITPPSLQSAIISASRQCASTRYAVYTEHLSISNCTSPRSASRGAMAVTTARIGSSTSS